MVDICWILTEDKDDGGKIGLEYSLKLGVGNVANLDG